MKAAPKIGPGAPSLPPMTAIVTIVNEVVGLNSCIGSKKGSAKHPYCADDTWNKRGENERHDFQEGDGNADSGCGGFVLANGAQAGAPA